MAGKIEKTLTSALGSLSNLGSLPGLGSLTDTMGMVRKTWTNFGLPTTFAPTMDLEELDKRITDLLAVEQWLVANQTMLRGTIQGLEVQRNTIATIQNLSQSLKNATAGTNPTNSANATNDLAALQALSEQFSGFSKTLPAAPSKPKTAARKISKSSKASSAKTKAVEVKAPTKTSTKAQPDSAANMPGLSPNAWWEMLQGQFNQIAQAAVASGTNSAVDAGKSVGKAASKVAGKLAKDAAVGLAQEVVRGAARRVIKKRSK